MTIIIDPRGFAPWTPRGCPSVTRLQIVPHGPVQSDVQGVADEGVADRHLVEMWKRAEQHEVVQIEVVARIDSEMERVREVRGFNVAPEAAVGGVLSFLERVRERLR